MSKIEVNQISSQCGSTLTIGQSGDTVTLACGATQSGFGRTGTVNWDTTAKTGNFTAVSGNGYFVNTTSGAITATLPAGSAGAIVAFADYANTFDTNNLTIAPNGTDKIGGTNANATVSTEGASTTFVYVDSTQGWKQVNDATLNTVGESFIVATGGTVTCCGDYKIHTFTGPGTFTVCSVGSNPAVNVVDYLVVAGGGGGESNIGGGGGAGGFRESSGNSGCYTASPLATPTGITVTATGYPITVGGGGGSCSSGSNSVFSTITSAGGGGGASGNGVAGGSGSGAARALCKPGGAGNTPPVAPPQGNDGGDGCPGPGSGGSGGGGGAIGSGANGLLDNNPGSGTGGAGAGTNINPATGESGPGPSRYYAGGGGGAVRCGCLSSIPGGVGGIGGGGDGGGGPVTAAGTAGTANTGGGGGAGDNSVGGCGAAGGSGIVIIRYKYQ